jgi:hypothetical protein
MGWAGSVNFLLFGQKNSLKLKRALSKGQSSFTRTLYENEKITFFKNTWIKVTCYFPLRKRML